MVWQMVADGVADAFHLSPKQRKSRNGPQDHADRRATPERAHADRRSTRGAPSVSRRSSSAAHVAQPPRPHLARRSTLNEESSINVTAPQRHSASPGATSQRLDEGSLTGHSVAHRAQGRRSSSLVRWGSRAHTHEEKDVERMIFPTFARSSATTPQRDSASSTCTYWVRNSDSSTCTYWVRNSASSKQRLLCHSA